MDIGSPSWITLLWTHIIRSALEWGQKSNLDSELALLRVEVARARDLLGSFNQVLEVCENSNSWLRLANRVWLVSAFCLLVVCALTFFGPVLGKGKSSLCKAEKSSEETPYPALTVSAAPRGRPGRPSDRQKARDETL